MEARHTSYSNHDVISGVTLSVDRHRLCIGEAPVSADNLHLAVTQHASIDAVQSGNIRVAHVLEGLPVERISPWYIEAEMLGLVQDLRHGRSVPHNLLGHASDVDTGASQCLSLNEPHFGAVARRTSSRCNSSRATSDHLGASGRVLTIIRKNGRAFCGRTCVRM